LKDFVSKDRNEPPDIDIDFEHERRERSSITSTEVRARASRAHRRGHHVPPPQRRARCGKALGLRSIWSIGSPKDIEWLDKGIADPGGCASSA